jgi:spermidine synthase
VASPFNEVVARRIGERVDLDVEGATFASYHPRLKMTGYSWDALTAASLLHPDSPPRSLLLLGLGGGTMLHQLRTLVPHIDVVAVEIDPEIVRLAREHMALEETGAEVVVDDAYAFLHDCKRTFDVVVDDLFLTGPDDVERSGIPEGAVLDDMRARLNPRGVLVANLITDVGHRAVRRATRASFRASFAEVRVVKPPRGLNEILVGGAALSKPRMARKAGERLGEAEDRRLWSLLGYEALKLKR